MTLQGGVASRSMPPRSIDEHELFAVLRRHVGAWYEEAYGSAEPHARMIDFYAAGTQARADRLLGPLKAQLMDSPPARILDVGCGFASIPTYLAWQWPRARVLATDATDRYYRCGRAAAEELGLDNIAFETHAIGEIDASATFDLVLCCNMLNFLTSREQVEDGLRRLCAATRPGGLLCVYTPHFWTLREPFTGIPLLHVLPVDWQDVIARRLGRRSTMRDVRNPSVSEITRPLRACGATPLGIEPASAVARLSNRHVVLWFRN